jgi:ATP-dependent Clp protease ATP-binding subunit ClpC
MKIELPLVLSRGAGRLVRGLVPGLSVEETASSVAALRDELALRIMVRFESARPAEAARYQRAPHQRLRHVRVDTFARDPETQKKRELKAVVGVLLEKWPADPFWVATPIRLPAARFALADLEALESALPRRLAELAQETGLESLEGLEAARDERLEILEVSVYPPTILPRGPDRPAGPARRRAGGRAGRKPGGTTGASGISEPAETAVEREERRQRRRLTAATLRAVARNLSYGADDEATGRAFRREAIVAPLVDELHLREGTATVLVGPSGVGKSAIVHEVARRLAERGRAVGLRRDVWRVDGGRFIAGMKYVGQWEARARALAQELLDTGDVLYADDLASLVFAGRTRSSDRNLARYLEPHLARGEITILAESTPERLERVREEEPTFAAHFRIGHVPPLSDLATLEVLVSVLRELEAESGAGAPPRLEPAALEAVLVGSQRFRPHEVYPGKAVSLLRRVLEGTGAPAAGSGGGPTFRTFGVDSVHETLRAETGLPPFVLGAEAPRERQAIRRELGALIAGQPEAVDAVADVVLALETALGAPDKPLATLLFVGPTGVGKTETAKALARYLYGSADRLLRFDMSELASPGSVGRLVGVVGGADGELTSALRLQPFRVILFDEVEKAHPRVFDALLQLLGEGRLSDASGRLANASASVILLTSNLGVREAAARPGFLGAGDEAREHYIAAVRGFFRPELFNRIDRIVPFGPLDKPALRVVVEHALGDLLSRRGIQRSNVLCDVEPELLDALVEQAYDPRYGARPLRRTLERRLTVPLAHHLATRRGDDWALVELFRSAGPELGIAVRILADAPAAPADGLEAVRGLPGLRALFASTAEEVAALRASPAFAEWPDLEGRWDELAAGLQELEADGLAETQFVETVDETSMRAFPEWERSEGYRGRGGLRPRQGFTEVPVTLGREALERRLRAKLGELVPRLTLLAHQARVAQAAGGETRTLLLECAGLWDDGALRAAAEATLGEVLRPERWEEVAARGGPATWSPAAQPPWAAPHASATSPRRLAFVYSGPGVAGILAPLVGWALVEVMREGVFVSVPVRLELLEGGMPDAAVERDRRVRAERERRRHAEAGQVTEAGVVVLRKRAGKPLLAVATGGRASDTHALAAALIRIHLAGQPARGGP